MTTRAVNINPTTPAQLRATLSRLRGVVQEDGATTDELREFRDFLKLFTNRQATADSDIAARSAVRVSSEGHIDLADASDISTADVAGVAIDDIPNGGLGEYIALGVLESQEWSLTAGLLYYLSTTAGNLVTTPTDATGNVSTIVGRALSQTELFVNPREIVIL